MPDQQIVAYYDAIAPKILPFLRDRAVAVRHQFGSAFVFRRHRPGAPRSWIRISTKGDLLEIVRNHGYEFYPHLDGDKDMWFALDIDIRAVPLPLGKRVVQETMDLLEERRVRFLLTYSGGNGFHIRWSFAHDELPRDRWGFLRSIVHNLQEDVEERLQRSSARAEFAKVLPRGDPMTELNAMDRRAQHSVLFDELILKKQATIRAPFSLHMKRRLVAVPLAPAKLSTFVPERDATLAVARRLPAVRLPRNSVARFLSSPWISKRS